MKKSQVIELLNNDAELIVSRERCTINSETVSRRIVDELFREGKLAFTRKVNNFTKAYKLAK